MPKGLRKLIPNISNLVFLYKIYRNQLNRLIKQSKVLYFRNLVDASKLMVTLEKHR